MASSKIPKDIDPAAQYRVTLKAPIDVAGRRLLPRPDLKVTLKGSVLLDNKAAIAAAELAAPAK